LLVILALIVPGATPAAAEGASPTLIFAPASGAYGPDCAGRVMALGDRFPEGAGVALYALKAPGLPLTVENIRTLVATVVVRDGRFVSSYVGLDSVLCAERGADPAAYPDGSRIEIVATIGTDLSWPFPRNGTELARAAFVVERGRPLPMRQRCFAETLLCTQGRFLDYWEANGGLARNGFPLTPERIETLEDGKAYTVQYFERVRLEYHPENAPPYDVLLGQFGRRVLSESYAESKEYVRYREAIAPVGPLAGAQFFPETGHNLGGRFLAYWQANGGLAQFGFPLTEERTDSLLVGRDYQQVQTQYFERARLEYHPENAGTPYEVLLGQFGRQLLGENALLAGPFARLYFTETDLRERLGAPRGAAQHGAGSAQSFEHGLMVWRGDTRRITVLAGSAYEGELVLPSQYATDWADLWEEGSDPGGQPAPIAGRYSPHRGFFKLWNEQPRVREALGYATTPEEYGYQIAVQEFAAGFLCTVESPDGAAIYAVTLQATVRMAAPLTRYVRYTDR
jgi:hypothetical protein